MVDKQNTTAPAQGQAKRIGRPRGSKNPGKKNNASKGTSRFASNASWVASLAVWWTRQTRFRTYDELRLELGCSYAAVKVIMAGHHFPRPGLCDKWFSVTKLDCFGRGRDRARAEHRRLIPATVKRERLDDYVAHAEQRRKASRESFRKRYEAQQQKVGDEELELLRKNPNQRPEVCRACGQIGADGGHVWRKHRIANELYKEQWGFNRSANAHRSEATQHKQREAMKRRGVRPPKWTHELLKKAKRTRLPGSGRLQETLNRSKSLGARPDKWKRTSKGDLITDTKIARLHLRGWALGKIAKAVELSVSATHFRLERMGYDGRAHAYLHGEMVGPRHWRDYRADFHLSVDQAAADVNVTKDWAYSRLNNGDREDPVAFALGSRIVAAIQTQTATFRLRPATRQGGRPGALPPSQRAELRSKYRPLLLELQVVHSWLAKQGKVSSAKFWEWLCNEFRARRFPLLRLWPSFFEYMNYTRSHDTFLAAQWTPNDLTRQFVAADFDVTEETARRIISHKS